MPDKDGSESSQETEQCFGSSPQRPTEQQSLWTSSLGGVLQSHPMTPPLSLRPQENLQSDKVEIQVKIGKSDHLFRSLETNITL